ncbi:MAG: SCO family protein [Bacteroidetes bacterium]|nr:MAG: SCO family protein [Bacteroidota bacterium]
MEKNSSSLLKFSILAALLIAPATFYFMFVTSGMNYTSLNYYGPKDVEKTMVDGEEVIDTVYHSIPDFSFTDQNGNTVNGASFDSKVYVADFFFTSCQSICPIMTSEMLRVQQHFEGVKELAFLSHTVDPETDSLEVLKAYQIDKNTDESNWHFVTGNKAELYEIARRGYFVPVEDGDGGPEDFIHSPMLMLIDKEKHIRGFYDGTNSEQVDKLIEDIRKLLTDYVMSKKR